MRKATKIGFIAVFCAAVGLTFPVFNIFSKQLSMDSHENRLMTGLPQVLQSPLSQLPRSLDNFFVDNSPFRYQFVLLNAGIDYAVFGTSQSDQVLPGKDGWLFYKDGPTAFTASICPTVTPSSTRKTAPTCWPATCKATPPCR